MKTFLDYLLYLFFFIAITSSTLWVIKNNYWSDNRKKHELISQHNTGDKEVDFLMASDIKEILSPQQFKEALEFWAYPYNSCSVMERGSLFIITIRRDESTYMPLNTNFRLVKNKRDEGYTVVD